MNICKFSAWALIRTMLHFQDSQGHEILLLQPMGTHLWNKAVMSTSSVVENHHHQPLSNISFVKISYKLCFKSLAQVFNHQSNREKVTFTQSSVSQPRWSWDKAAVPKRQFIFSQSKLAFYVNFLLKIDLIMNIRALCSHVFSDDSRNWPISGPTLLFTRLSVAQLHRKAS